MIGLWAVLAPLAVYLSCPSTFWNFDGVACAAALELGNPVYLFHVQHLLYGFFGLLFWKALAPVGVVKALPALQLFCSVLTAVGLGFLWRALRDITHDPWLALLFSTAAGLGAAVWVWSVEAQVYPLGFLGLAGATAFLLAPNPAPRMRAIGAWHALAILGHVVHVLWAIPALYWIRKNRLPWKSYVTTMIGLVVLAYAEVWFCVLRRHHGQGAWLSYWIKGSLGLTTNRSIAWHWPGWSGPWQWLQATPGQWWGTFWPYGGVSIPTTIHLLSVASQLALAGLLILALRRWRVQPLVGFALLWIGVYALFFCTWEPGMLCYRMADAIPYSLLFAIGVQALPVRATRYTLAGFWLVSLGIVNFCTRAWPMHDTARNWLYQQTVLLAKVTPERSIYLTEGGLPWIYMLYFTGRSAWNVQAMSLADFDASWSQLKPRPALYAMSSLLRDPQAAAWLLRHPMHVLPDLPWLEVS